MIAIAGHAIVATAVVVGPTTIAAKEDSAVVGVVQSPKTSKAVVPAVSRLVR